jgi:hypothetical protein
LVQAKQEYFLAALELVELVVLVELPMQTGHQAPVSVLVPNWLSPLPTTQRNPFQMPHLF